MPTNLHIDTALLNQAKLLGHHRTKRDAVNEALREYVEYRKRLEAEGDSGPSIPQKGVLSRMIAGITDENRPLQEEWDDPVGRERW